MRVDDNIRGLWVCVRVARMTGTDCATAVQLAETSGKPTTDTRQPCACGFMHADALQNAHSMVID